MVPNVFRSFRPNADEFIARFIGYTFFVFIRCRSGRHRLRYVSGNGLQMESGETLAVVQRSYATTSPAFVGIHNGLYFDVALDGSS